ncbi:MAG: M23 family metallopeptidase [Bacillota bacterium]|nr:M23 family metallopeptidase [Bacillota bacterium]
MLGSFKMRILMVIVLVAVLGVIMQSDHCSKRIVTPVLQNIMDTDYSSELKETVFSYLPWTGEEGSREPVPVTGINVLHQPCEFEKIEKSYGWHWSKLDNTQEFFPGVSLRVSENTPVKPIVAGQVIEIQRDENNGVVTVKHSDDFYSVYGGLKEVLIETDETLDLNRVIGKTGERLYFEVRTSEGPVDPHSIFN